MMPRLAGPLATAALLVVVSTGCGSVSDGSTASESTAGSAATVDLGASAEDCPVPTDTPDGPEAGTVTGDIRIFAAASTAAAFDELGGAFTDAQPDSHVEVVTGASSELVARLDAGAPADVLATADAETMRLATDAGNVSDPMTFACNRMALLVGAGNPLGIDDPGDLARDDVRFVLCAPEVPCGRLGRDVLERAGVTARPVGSEANVAAVVAKVASGEVDAGITYVTDARTSPDLTDAVAIPDGLNVTTAYPIGLVDDADEPSAARAFIDFVGSPTGRDILGAHGFLTG